MREDARAFFPGTLVELRPDIAPLKNSAAWGKGGMMLSQIRELTGLETSAIQNWVKRGFLPPAKGKRYTVDQVARILLINALRGTMRLEHIQQLLSYINGNLLDTADDTIEDSKLYDYLCVIAGKMRERHLSEGELRAEIRQLLAGYQEPVPEARAHLENALLVMALSYESAHLRDRAYDLLSGLTQAGQQ